MHKSTGILFLPQKPSLFHRCPYFTGVLISEVDLYTRAGVPHTIAKLAICYCILHLIWLVCMTL